MPSTFSPKRPRGLFAALLPLLLALPAGAQTGSAQPETPASADEAVTVTETMTVTASRAGERPVTDLPVSITVLPRETLEVTPALTVDELLRNVPSVELPLQSSVVVFPANPSLAIRGLGLGDNSTRTLLLLDGLPMNGAFFGNVFWNRVPKEDVDRVEVVRGASSSLFGSYAMGGVVHLVTRRPEDGTTLSFNGLGGSDETFQANVFAAGGGERLRLAANLNGFSTAGYFQLAPEDRGAIDERSGAEVWSGSVKADLAVTPRLRLRGRVGAFNEEHDAETRLGRNETETRDLALGLLRQGAAESHWEAEVFYVDEEFSTDNVSLVAEDSRDAEFVSNAHVTPSEDLGASLRWSRGFSSRGLLWTVGADYRSISGEDDALIFSAPGALAFRKIGSGDQRSLGLFAELGWSAREKLEVQASLRLDRFETSNGRDVTAGVVTEFADKEIDEVSPRLGLRYQASPAVAVRGAFYRGFRAPSLANLYRAFGTATFQGLPNPQLDSERLTGGEVGLDLTAGRAFTQVNAFYNHLEDMVGGVVVAFDPIFTLMNQNLGEARTRGVELITDVNLGSAWSFSASYIYTDAEITANLDDPGLVGNALEGAPEHAANLGMAFKAGPRTDLSLRGRYRSRQFQDVTNETLLPSYSVADAYASYSLSPRAAVYAEITNLLDRDYVADAFGGLNHFAAPRQFFVGVRLKSRS
jgi:outer membrane receptor protein involved in Fe transport